MSYSVNKATVLGNLVEKPPLKYIPSGSAVSSCRIATNREWFDKESQTKKSVAEFHNLVFWEKSAEIINKFGEKGTKLYAEGRMQTRSWDDKNGVTRYTTEIVVNDFVILTNKKRDEETTVPVEEPEGFKTATVTDSEEVFSEKEPEVDVSPEEEAKKETPVEDEIPF